eukprot:4418084-Prymnesium_polylepis.1
MGMGGMADGHMVAAGEPQRERRPRSIVRCSRWGHGDNQQPSSQREAYIDAAARDLGSRWARLNGTDDGQTGSMAGCAVPVGARMRWPGDGFSDLASFPPSRHRGNGPYGAKHWVYLPTP